MVEIFDSVLKGARFLSITALVQLTFYRVNSYFAVRCEQGEARPWFKIVVSVAESAETKNRYDIGIGRGYRSVAVVAV